MDSMAMNGNSDVLRRALSLAMPVGQLGSSGMLVALDGALKTMFTGAKAGAKAGHWGITSAARLVNRGVISPLGSLAFGNSSAAASSNVSFCTHSACPQLTGRHHPSRTEAKLLKAASGLRSGSAKCSIRRQGAVAAAQPALITLLSMPCAVPAELHDDHPSSDSDVAEWTVTSLGLQSSML